MEHLTNQAGTKNNNARFATAKNRIYAYRINQMDPIQQKEVLSEGFDDDGEEGSGEKLQGVLQKMDIVGILCIICIWNNGVTLGEMRVKGGELYRVITERAREMLSKIKKSIITEGGEMEKPQISLAQKSSTRLFQGLDRSPSGRTSI
jgi:putative IMPACT (imprinted ancient) family translation regulator